MSSLWSLGWLVAWLQPKCTLLFILWVAGSSSGGAQQLKRKNRASNSFGGSCCSAPLYSGTMPYYVQINIREMIIQWYLAGNFPKCSSGNVCVVLAVQCRGQKDARTDGWMNGRLRRIHTETRDTKSGDTFRGWKKLTLINISHSLVRVLTNVFISRRRSRRCDEDMGRGIY